MSVFRIVVLGTGGVGKSALVIQFVRNYFETEYDPTIEDVFCKQVIIDKAAYTLEILDTAGQEEYSSLRDQYMRTGNGFLLIYAINDPQSFAEIPKLIRSIQRIKEADKNPIPIVLAANKCDLDDQLVNQEAGKDLANSYGIKFLETSAKTRTNVDEAFCTLVRLSRPKRRCFLL